MATIKDFIVKNGLNVLGAGSPASVNTSTGAITTPGGIGVGGDVNIGGYIHVGTTSTVAGAEIITTATVGNYAGITAVAPGTAISVSSSTVGRILTYTVNNTGVTAISSFDSYLGVSNSTGSVTLQNLGVTTVNNTDGFIGVSNGTGTVTLSNLGVTKVNAFTGNVDVIAGSSIGVVTATNQITINNLGVTSVAGDGTIGVNASTGSVTFTNLGVTQVTGGTDITVSTSTGSVTINDASTLNSVTGRGATTGNAISLTNNTDSTATTNGALTVTGGVGIGRNLQVGGDAHIVGDLYVDGTQFIVNTVTVSTGDKTFTLANTSPNAAAASGAGLLIGSTSTPYASLTFDGAGSWVSLGNINPSANNTYDLGTSSTQWQNIYGQHIYVNGSAVVTEADLSALGVSSITGGTDISVNTSTGAVTISDTSTLDSVTTRGASTTNGITVGNLTDSALSVAGGLVFASASTAGLLADDSNLTWNGTTLTVTGGISATSIVDTALTNNGGVLYNGGSGALADSSGLTYDGSGNLTVGTSLAISGSGGDITMSGGNITGVNAITMTGELTIGATGTSYKMPTADSTVAGYVLTSDAAGNATWQATAATLNIAADIGSPSTVDLLSQTFTIAGGTAIDTSVSGQTITINNLGVAAINGGVGIGIDNSTGTVTLTNLGVTTATGSTYIGVSTSTGNVTFTNLGVTYLTGSTYLGVSQSTGSVTLSNLGVTNLTGGTDITVSTSTGSVTISDTSTLESVTTRGATTDQAISITNATASTATTNGALTVTGGVGIGGALYVGGDTCITGNLYVDGTQTIVNSTIIESGDKAVYLATTTVLATLATDSGLFIGSSTSSFINWVFDGIGAWKTSGRILNHNTTDASNTYTGSVVLDGGLGVGKNLYAENVYSSGSLVITEATLGNYGVSSLIGGTDISVNTSSGAVTISDTSTLESVTTRGATTDQAISITNTNNSTYGYGYGLSGTSQALGVAGGIKALGDISVGGVVYTGLNDGGDVGGQSPANKTINGLFITNNMQAGGTYQGIAGTTPVTIDSWSVGSYTSAKYTIQVVDSGKIHVVELMIVQDGTNVYISEYGLITTAGELGTFDGLISGGNLQLTFTPASLSSATLQVVRQSILAGIETWC